MVKTSPEVVYFRATWCTFQFKLEKNLKIPTRKKNAYISGNGNPKKAFYITGDGIFSPFPRNFLIFQKTEIPKNFLNLLKRKLSLYFRKRKP